MEDKKGTGEGIGKRENALYEPIWPVQVEPDRLMPDGERYNSIK